MLRPAAPLFNRLPNEILTKLAILDLEDEKGPFVRRSQLLVVSKTFGAVVGDLSVSRHIVDCHPRKNVFAKIRWPLQRLHEVPEWYKARIFQDIEALAFIIDFGNADDAIPLGLHFVIVDVQKVPATARFAMAASLWT
ncbi:hypothetical protein HDV00_009358 [Rhizophlyctis rosea]|nr:hypothetical protein HDV00_009358 [Rhizophlyctis rosea]